jgi:hypothetical protein
MKAEFKFDPWLAIGRIAPEQEAALRLEATEDARAERQAIMNEPTLPPPGSSARRVIDLEHERMIRGLIAASRRRGQ